MPRDRDILTYHSQEVKNDSNFDQDLSKVNQAEKGRNMPTRHLEKGKIMPSRISFVSTSKQRLLSKAIKKARTLALISHVGKSR